MSKRTAGSFRKRKERWLKLFRKKVEPAPPPPINWLPTNKALVTHHDIAGALIGQLGLSVPPTEEEQTARLKQMKEEYARRFGSHNTNPRIVAHPPHHGGFIVPTGFLDKMQKYHAEELRQFKDATESHTVTLRRVSF